MPPSPALYPLLFDPIYKEKVWGGRALERLGRSLPGDGATPIGESWELVDLASTSVSGGGGAAEHSAVSNGPLAGTTIDRLIADYRGAITGRRADEGAPGGFPVLIKYLDASDNLSVQVHPSPAYAEAHPEAHLKSEAWYVVDCEPGAVIYKGLARGVTAERFRAALETNTDAAVVPLLHTVPVKPGDCHYLPSGTCHALGAGVLVAEVQTPSDTTFRVYDWGRTGRELHIEQALACIDFDSPATGGPNAWEVNEPAEDEAGARVTALVRCPYFEIELAESATGGRRTPRVDRPEVWMVLEGGLVFAGDGSEPITVPIGKTVLLPPGMGGCGVTANAGSRWLRVSVPE